MIKLFLVISLAFLSCSATKWKKRYIEKNVARIVKQYNNNGSFPLSFLYQKVEDEQFPQPDSNGFTPARYYKPPASHRKKQLKTFIRQVELATAIVPDSLRKNNETIDSIYTNPYKIEYLEKNYKKTERMIFIR